MGHAQGEEESLLANKISPSWADASDLSVRKAWAFMFSAVADVAAGATRGEDEHDRQACARAGTASTPAIQQRELLRFKRVTPVADTRRVLPLMLGRDLNCCCTRFVRAGSTRR